MRKLHPKEYSIEMIKRQPFFAPQPDLTTWRILKGEEEEIARICPKCGTVDCIPHEEYLKHIRISNRGGMSVPSDIARKTCRFRQQMNAAKHLVGKKLSI